VHAQIRLGSLTFHYGAHLVNARFKFICTARAGDLLHIFLGKRHHFCFVRLLSV
jgi:hypothetical protein